MKPPKQFNIGQFVISEPCTMAWDEMESVGDCKRFCEQCNKQVHDLTGKSRSEIKRMFDAHGGSLCAAFDLDEKGEAIIGEEIRPSRIRYLKHWAAAASLFLIYQIPYASLPTKEICHREAVESRANHPTNADLHGGNPNNTLVTAVLVADNGTVIHHDLKIEIRKNGNKIAETVAVAGLLYLDLQAVAQPNDSIEIVVKGKHVNEGKFREYIYHDAEQTVQLGYSQNLEIQVQMGYKYHGSRGRKKNQIVGRMSPSFD